MLGPLPQSHPVCGSQGGSDRPARHVGVNHEDGQALRSDGGSRRGMDKKKAARQAASVASAVANGNGAPHMRVVARIVAHTLTAIGNQQADGAAAVRSPSRRATALTTPA